MSLKKDLTQKILDYAGATFTYSELIEYCRIWGYKISNAERRLREVTSPEDSEIEIVMKKNYILGYRATGKQGRMW